MYLLMTIVAALVFFVVAFGWWGIIATFLYWAMLTAVLYRP